MMDSELVKAQRYHHHARDLQAMAAQEVGEELKIKLLELASQYDELCEMIVSRHLDLNH